ncbi:PJA2 ligase, partial [Crotophaga sulcirostris]|nr:PJA2 ligase [Crotophaga sulcirostris]
MGQETSKPAWPIPAGGYAVLTERRYRRRHSRVVFRQSLDNQDKDKHQRNEDCEQLELERVWRENLCSGPLVQVSSGLLDKTLLENTGMGEPVRQNVSRQTSEVNVSGSQNSGNFVNPYKNSEDLAEVVSGWRNDLSSQNAIAYVNIDSYEPDSSDGEEDDGQDQSSLRRGIAAVFQETLDNGFSDLLKDSVPFSDLQSQLSALSHSVSRECCEEAGPMPLMRYSSTDSELACSNRTLKSSTEDQAILKSNLRGADYEIERIKKVDVGTGTPLVIANELNVSGGEAEQGNSTELVVRPKIRKQNTANWLERDKLLPTVAQEESGSRRITEIAEVRGHADCAWRNSKREMSSSMFFDSEYEGPRRNTEIDLNKNAAAQERESVLDKRTSCDEFKDCRRHFSMFLKDEDSSECSDGECSTAVPAYFTAAEEYRSFCDKWWETVLPGEKCESEVQSSSSSSSGEEENTDIFFKGWNESNVLGSTLLEEGEIACLQYQEEVESSSGEEEESVRGFLNHGFFVMDGNNNFEDNSSLGEDLDVEWRLLDEASDGLGLAQTMAYVDSQFFRLEALEGRLQQTVETALAHLQSFGFVEQAPPPATKEIIDCLPQVVITDDHDGQEQCTICWSEFEKVEIITELPCRHFFHKSCVCLWLQKSGTCPLCRHVLVPVLPEAAAATVSFLSDGDSASSV